MMRRIFINLIRVVFGSFVLIALVQLGFAWCLHRSPVGLRDADLVVVFPGDADRIAAGCKLVKDGYSVRLMITNKAESSLKAVAAKNNLPTGATLLSGGTSRSSFEDAYITSQVVEALDLQSLILVTSAYHLPRSLYLLKTFLAMNGSKVDVQYYPVRGGHNPKRQWQLCYNEIMKLWGSSSEMAGFWLTGHLILDSPTITKIKSFLKDAFLFNV